MAKSKVILEFQIVQKGKNFSIIQKEQEKHNKTLDQTDKKTKNLNKSQSDNYNRQKQGVIQTANSTKNFSKLSQTVGGDGGGPGGLVRAYALLAANVFALTAAFGVLSRSAQIDTLNQSMEVLSTTGGTYIRNVAKEMQAASGFAVDLAQSFRQVSLAASAGLNTSEIEGLTKVAKGAAISLGRNLPDAMDRIFRGAIKLEPEILDEIGLFVRVDEAAQKYARNNGKVVSALTQVEKRQAFLNEILEQGTKKFAEYAEEIKPDSYVRLAAALSDIAQNGLSAINKRLGPFLDGLSQSKGLLTLVFGGLVTLLLKKAIPAMGLMTKTSAESANQAAETAREYTNALDTETKNQVEIANKGLNDRLKAEKDGLKKFKQKGPISKASGAKEIDAEVKRATKGQTRINALKAKDKQLTKQIGQSQAKNKAILEADQKILREEIDKLERIKQITKDIALNEERGSAAIKSGSLAARTQAKLDRKAASSAAIAQSVGVSETQGFTAGFKELNTQIKAGYEGMDKFGKTGQQQFGVFRKAAMFAQGGVGILTGQINKLMMMLGPWIMLFTMVAAAAAFLAKKLGINDKNAQALNETVQNTIELTENINKRFDSQVLAMSSLTFSYREINKATLAYNKGQRDLVQGIDKLQKAFEKWKESASGAALAYEKFLVINATVPTGTAKVIEFLFGTGNAAKTMEAQVSLAKESLKGMLKAGDETGIAIMEGYGVNLESVTKLQASHSEALEAASEAQKNVTAEILKAKPAEANALDIIEKKIKAGIKLEDSEISTIQRYADEHKVLSARFDANVNLFNSTKLLELGVDNLDISQKQAVASGKDMADSTNDRIAAAEALESALAGAAESIGKFNQAFMPKTKVDDIIGSFSQINSALAMKDAQEMGSGRKAFFDDFLKADNPFRTIVSGSTTAIIKDGKEVGRKLRTELFKELNMPAGATEGDVFEKLFLQAQETVTEYREQIILSKIQIAEFTKAAKRYNSISAGGLSVNIKEQKALLNIQKKNVEVAQSETDILLVNNGLDRSRLKAMNEALAGAKTEEERAKVLQEYGKSEIDILSIRGAITAENTATMEKELKVATHLFEAEQARLKALQKVQQAQKQVTEAKLAEFKLDQQISNLKTKGTTALSAGDESKFAIEAASKKLEMFLIEAKTKKLLLDIEEKIVLARLRVLAKSDPQLDAELGMIEKQLTAGTKAAKSALDVQMSNAVKTFTVELSAATTAAFGKSMVEGIRTAGAAGRAEIKEMERTRADRRKKAVSDAVDASNAAGGSFTDGIAAGVKGGSDFDAQEKEDQITAKKLNNQQLLRESLLKSAEMFKTMGPEGAFIGTVLAGTVAISDSMVEMGKVFETAGTGFEGSMEKASAAAQFASEAIGAVGSIMAANSAQQVAAIDKQIAAEQKRDGKSAASIARIKALEGKKEAMQRKAFNQNKKMMMAQAVANTAAAITQTFADKGYPEGVPFAAVMAGIGALQLALIAKTSYQGGGSDIEEPKATALSIGGRNNSVDVSKRKSSGELSYLRGERGSGTGANDFRTGGATGMKGYATGQPIMVGEQGPERIDIVPNEDLGKSMGTTNINFNISAVDGQSVQRMLNDQQGNIIGMIQSAANETGEEFLPQVDPSVYGAGG